MMNLFAGWDNVCETLVPETAPQNIGRMAVASSVGSLLLGTMCFGRFRREWRHYKEDEIHVLLLHHVLKQDVSLVLADLKQGADPAFRNHLSLHLACSTVAEKTPEILFLLSSAMSGLPPTSSADLPLLIEGGEARAIPPHSLTPLPSPSHRFTSIEKLVWALLEMNLRSSTFAPLDTSFGGCSPVSRLCRTAKQRFEENTVWSFDIYTRALTVLCTGTLHGEGENVLGMVRPMHVNDPDRDGKTPLMHCVAPSRKNSEQFALESLRVFMLSPSIDLNVQEATSGYTALHFICERFCRSTDTLSLYRCLRMILEHATVDVNIRDRRGNTCLHLLVKGYVVSKKPAKAAKQTSSLEVLLKEDLELLAIVTLLQAGANQRLENHHSEVPYVIASRAGIPLLCSLLSEPPPPDRTEFALLL